ncbi:MAG: hypothetical protein ACE5HO_13820 [bacterium]
MYVRERKEFAFDRFFCIFLYMLTEDANRTLFESLILVLLVTACGHNPASPPTDLRPVRADFQKGMTFVCWSADCLSRSEAQSSLKNVVNTGANWLAIVVTGYQETATSSSVFLDPQLTSTDEALLGSMALARTLGFKVFLKPHLDVLDGSWRGNIAPENLNAWFESYRAFILRYAGIAREFAVEQFSVGTELPSMSGYAERWRQIIAAVRASYSGALLYSANWDEYTDVEFWDALDYVGIDAFFPLTRDANADFDQILNGWQAWADVVSDWQKTVQKEIIFTEIGYANQNGTNIQPFNAAVSSQPDPQEQSDCYRAALVTFADQAWLKGAYWWRWRADLRGGPADLGYTPYQKPAEAVLTSAWRGFIQ